MTPWTGSASNTSAVLHTQSLCLLEIRSPNRFQAVDTSRLVSESGDSETMPKSLLRVVNIIVRDRGVGSNPVVPQCNGAFFPSNTNLEVLAVCYMLDKGSH